MSSRFKKIKVKKIKTAKIYHQPPIYHTSFNIFTKDGSNLTEVKSPRPMTLEEAQYHFDALSIGAND